MKICVTSAILEISGKLNLFVNLNQSHFMIAQDFLIFFPFILKGISMGASKGVGRGTFGSQQRDH